MNQKTLIVRSLVALGALAIPVLYACGLAQSVQSTKVLAATVIATPEYDLAKLITIPDGGFKIGDASFSFDGSLSFDGSIPFPDGGLKIGDASIPFFGDGGFTTKNPPQTIAQVFIGERDASDLKKPPVGIAGAKVTLTIAGGAPFELKEKEKGVYLLTTVENSALQYVADKELVYTVDVKGEKLTAKVIGPKKEDIEQFKVLGGAPLPHEAGKELKLTRASAENIGLTSVFPISSSAEQGKPTYTDAPTKPEDLIDLVANPDKWKQKTITIPGSAFPQAGTKYLVNVTAVKKGTTSDNLFLGSVFVAGIADLALVQTK